MSERWLGEVLRDAASRRLCTEIHCGTCGALEFQRALLSALSHAQGINPQGRLDSRMVGALLPPLRELQPAEPGDGHAMEPAIRFILYRLWTGVPAIDRVLEEGLAGTWSGVVLDRMKAHHAARVRAREEAAQAPARAAERREARRQLKQAQHAARLALKTERDHQWRTTHSQGS